MAILLSLGSKFGFALFRILLTIFSTRIVEKGVAVVAFKSLRWLAAQTTNEVDNEVVRQMEIAYYGEERYAQVRNRPARPIGD